MLQELVVKEELATYAIARRICPSCERKQLELALPDDPLHEFVVSVDTAHVRGNDSESARNFEVVIARCGRGGRGTQPAIILRQLILHNVKFGRERCRLFKQRDMPGTERLPFCPMARKS